MEISTKIQPLLEDIGLILTGEFLKSTDFKRWLVEHNLDEIWAQYFNYVKSNRNFFALDFDHDAADSKETMGYMLNAIFEQQKDKMPAFLLELLSFYSKQISKYIDISNIKKDLLAVGYTKEDVAKLDNVFIPPHIEETIEEEQTQEQTVRSLEHAYLSQREENSRSAVDTYLNWHCEALLYLSNYYTEANRDYSEFKHLDNSGNGHTLRNNFKAIYSKYNLLMNNVTIQEMAMTTDNSKKTPLVFISHSHEDDNFVISLVSLLEDMGFSKETLFCSSVHEYGIKLSSDIFDTIRGLFHKHDLYVIFIHSPRFYGSAVALNEMGAAWVLKTDFCSILTNDMEYSEMKGVVSNAKISIKIDDKDAPLLLNDLYKHLISIFSFEEMDLNKWERKRDQFLSVVKNLKYEDIRTVVKENDVDTKYKKLQIAKMKEESEARRKALIRGNIINGYKGSSSTLKIFNAGLATARNVQVAWLNEDDTVITSSDFSQIGELTPQNARSYALHLTNGHPETMILCYSWDDDYKEGNTLEESLQL